MLLVTATATAAEDPTTGRLIVTAIVLAVAGWYAFACWFFPFRACTWCKGTSRWHQPGQSKRRRRRHFRACWVCKGTGKRLRIGRRIYNFVARTRDDAR